jgi:hypothetical protein
MENSLLALRVSISLSARPYKKGCSTSVTGCTLNGSQGPEHWQPGTAPQASATTRVTGYAFNIRCIAQRGSIKSTIQIMKKG